MTKPISNGASFATRAVGTIQRFGSIPAAIEIMGKLKLTVNEEKTRTSKCRKGSLMPATVPVASVAPDSRFGSERRRGCLRRRRHMPAWAHGLDFQIDPAVSWNHLIGGISHA